MGFKELLKDSVTEVFTYRTTKLVKTNDKFLVTLHFIFMALIATFALVSILLSHNYMLFELRGAVGEDLRDGVFEELFEAHGFCALFRRRVARARVRVAL